VSTNVAIAASATEIAMMFTLTPQQLQEAARLGRTHAEAAATIINDADQARRPALTEAAMARLLEGLASVHAAMRELGAAEHDVREHLDAATIGFSDRLVELFKH
jgi:hypothetical protein